VLDEATTAADSRAPNGIHPPRHAIDPWREQAQILPRIDDAVYISTKAPQSRRRTSFCSTHHAKNIVRIAVLLFRPSRMASKVPGLSGIVDLCLRHPIFVAAILFVGGLAAYQRRISIRYPSNLPLVREKAGTKSFSWGTRFAFHTDCAKLFRETYENVGSITLMGKPND
jgi:hypothetical protein